ncbi:MAG: 8-amino-7-oxononanoate synthase [Myxococcales bacterium]|nr:8-amino-7-oxononanoate synthase [Myxococcales bacterium]
MRGRRIRRRDIGPLADIVRLVSLDEDVRAELSALEALHRLRTPRTIDGITGPRTTIDGVEVVNLASNDYLSLAGDRRIARAAAGAVEADGVGAGASRLITGNHRRHVELERVLADWMQCGGVRLFNSGYAANVGVLTTLLAAGDVVFSDELNHASIIDGCRLSRAEIVVFRHRDLDELGAALGVHRGRRRVVVSESLFSMDGDLDDVRGQSELCKRHDAALMLDEAHAIGVMGPEGRGLAASVGVTPDLLIGTFGKALGTFGAFAATSDAIAKLLWNRARSFVFSTALPPIMSGATLAALEIVRGHEGDQRRRNLAANARHLRSLQPRAGGASESPIAPILVGDDRKVMHLSDQLFARGVFVQGIRPPTVPEGTSRLRLSLSAGHATVDIENTSRFLDDAMRQSE